MLTELVQPVLTFLGLELVPFLLLVLIVITLVKD